MAHTKEPFVDPAVQAKNIKGLSDSFYGRASLALLQSSPIKAGQMAQQGDYYRSLYADTLEAQEKYDSGDSVWWWAE